MPGRTPAEAFRAFIEPIQEALSCLGQAKAQSSPGGRTEPNQDHAWMINRGNGFTVKAWHFSAEMGYRIIRDETNGPWRVHTTGYRYRLSVAGQDVFRMHWHPNSKSPIRYPHLHANLSPKQQLAESLGAHLETDRMSLERALRWAFELGMPPGRADWEQCLQRSEELHLQHRTWARGGPPDR